MSKNSKKKKSKVPTEELNTAKEEGVEDQIGVKVGEIEEENDEICELALKDWSPNIYDRVAEDTALAFVATYTAFLLTSTLGWPKWVIRAAAGILGITIGEVRRMLKTRADRRSLIVMLENYQALTEEENRKATQATTEEVIGANLSTMSADLKDMLGGISEKLTDQQTQAAQLQNLIQGQQAQAEAISKSMKGAESQVVKMTEMVSSVENVQVSIDKANATHESKMEKMIGKLLKDVEISTDAADTDTDTASRGRGRPKKS